MRTVSYNDNQTGTTINAQRDDNGTWQVTAQFELRPANAELRDPLGNEWKDDLFHGLERIADDLEDAAESFVSGANPASVAAE